MQEQLIDIYLEEREHEINNLARGVQELSDLFTDVSLLVSDQEVQIDNIESNIQTTFSHIDKANIQLVKAKKYQKKKRNCYIKIFGIFFVIIIIIIIIIFVNNK